MKRSAVVAGALLSLAAVLSGCSSGEKPAVAKAPPPQVTGVTVAEVIEQFVPEIQEVMGTVRARTSAVVAARIPGTVILLHVREGDRVKKGQLLGRLESQESAATAAGAAAAIEESRRSVEEAQSRKKLADATFLRFEKLFQEQAVTRQEFEVRETERDVAAHALARAEARLKQAEESSRGATTMADYTRIVSPLSGIITAKHVDLGATVFPAQPLMTVEDEGSYRLELAVPESLRGRVRPGAVLTVAMDGASVTSGKVAEIVPTIDPASRTFTAKVDLAGGGLRSGMFGRAQVPVGGTKGIVVPVASVREQGNLTSVWVVDKERLARMRLVKLGKRAGEMAEVLAGLSAGERVVTAGVDRVVEGALVQ